MEVTEIVRAQYEDVSMRSWSLEEKVTERAYFYVVHGVIPLDPYETYVGLICSALRSWCKYSVCMSVDDLVDNLAKAYMRFIIARYCGDKHWDVKLSDEVFYNISDAEYETFSECLRADVCKEWHRRNGDLMGAREFIKREAKRFANEY